MSVLNELFTNGYATISLDIVSVGALLCGVAIIVSKNPILSLIFLIGLFASISVYLILSGLTFIGLSYLIVYIGAVSILFLFILMLINIRTSELLSDNSNSIALGLYITILANVILFQTLPYYMAILNSNNSKTTEKVNNVMYSVQSHPAPYNLIDGTINNVDLNTVRLAKTMEIHNNHNVVFVSSANWDGNMADTSHISSIGGILYSSHNIWLFLASFILLLAMVGAIIVTIKNEK